MRLEYFQLIDRIIELDLPNRTIRAEAVVPTASTIFEGHFPGHPLMPGVLLIEAMAQTAGWLVIARTKFERMPFLAAIKEASCAPSSRRARRSRCRRSWCTRARAIAVTEATIMAEGKAVCDADITLRLMAFPSAEFRASMEEARTRLAVPMEAIAHG